jgi:RHH-type transcriptional regulator, rel operon repressor / antitoxin RelB
VQTAEDFDLRDGKLIAHIAAFLLRADHFVIIDTNIALSYTVCKSLTGRLCMQKAASITVRVKPDTRKRLDEIARATRRTKSFVIEEALEQYLDVNEWQIKGIQEALAEADTPDAEWVDHEDVIARTGAKVAR